MTLPSFLTNPTAPPEWRPGTPEAKRATIAAIKRNVAPIPAPVVDVMRLRSQVRQLSDDDFRALMVAEAHARGMTGLWRILP
jgi:hypothetical protein